MARQNPDSDDSEQISFQTFTDSLITFENAQKIDSDDEQIEINKQILIKQSKILTTQKNPAPKSFRKLVHAFRFFNANRTLFLIGVLAYCVWFGFLIFFWRNENLLQKDLESFFRSNTLWFYGRQWLMILFSGLFFILVMLIRNTAIDGEDKPAIFIFLIVVFLTFLFAFTFNYDNLYKPKGLPQDLQLPDWEITFFRLGLAVPPLLLETSYLLKYSLNQNPRGATILFAGWLRRVAENASKQPTIGIEDYIYIKVMYKTFQNLIDYLNDYYKNSKGVYIANKNEILQCFCSEIFHNRDYAKKIEENFNPEFFYAFFSKWTLDIEVLQKIIANLTLKITLLPYVWWKGEKFRLFWKIIEIIGVTIGLSIITYLQFLGVGLT